MLSEAQRRAARCDSGRKLLQQVSWWPETEPIGNTNLSEVLEFVAWGWIDKNGLTKAGRAALQESNDAETM